MNLFKIIGLLLILFVCTVLGFYKSIKLTKRCKTLEEICYSLEKLSELIKCGTDELDRLIKPCFGDLVEINNGIKLKSEYILKDDIELFNKLISEIGISNREKEYKRIMFYKSLFQKQQADAESSAENLCKLYNSCGFWVGLAVCIFLI